MVSSLGNLCVCVYVYCLTFFSSVKCMKPNIKYNLVLLLLKKKRNLDSDANIWIGIRPFGKIEKTNQTWVYCPTPNFCFY